MFVKEFSKAPDSNELNRELGAVYKWNLNLNEMQGSTARDLLGSMTTKIKNIRSSRQGHHAERNPQFMEAVLVSKVLQTWLSEQDNAYSQARKANLAERELSKGEMKKREKYAKGMKPMAKDFKKRYGDRGEEVMYATATKMAKKESVDEAMEVLKGVLSGNSTLLEGELDSARAVMAARDMVDSIQKMVEDLSAMLNEELPALSDAIRDEISAEQAQAFVSTANGSIGPLLDSLKSARESMDNATRALTGEQPSMGATPNVPATGADMGAMPAAEPSELDTSDAATGGVEQPMGRAKR